jgi:hypothetical protein
MLQFSFTFAHSFYLLFLDTTKNVTGLIDILGYLERFLNHEDENDINTRRDKCKIQWN